MANVDPIHIPPASGQQDAASLRADVEHLKWVAYQLRERTGGGVDLVADIGVQQVTEDGGNRTYRRFLDDIDDINGRITLLKRQNRNLENEIAEIKSLLLQTKSASRLAEQKINELESRIDSGVL